jgi:hypothetical protein
LYGLSGTFVPRSESRAEKANKERTILFHLQVHQSFRNRLPSGLLTLHLALMGMMTGETRWDEKAGLRRDAVGSQVIDALEAQEIKETGNEED